MKILLCPDKFKGSLSAERVCRALGAGLLKANNNYDIVNIPIADGGDGSIDILKKTLQLTEQSISTVDPIGRKITTHYYVNQDAAFIELACASGIVLLGEYERNPLITSTRGTGLMIKNALDAGYKTIYLFIGGSATNDGGIGIAQALGFDFLSSNGDQLDPVGRNLINIHEIKNRSNYKFENININVLCDVSNPMHGANGAAYVYAKQKGASDKQIIELDQGLMHFDNILQTQFNKDIALDTGMGAAGAVGASLVGLLGAKLQNGFQMIAEMMKLEQAIKEADLVITGEGKVDATSHQGKVVGNVLSLCAKHNTQCCIVGGIIESAIKLKNVAYQKSIISLAGSQSKAMSEPEKYLAVIGEEIAEWAEDNFGKNSNTFDHS